MAQYARKILLGIGLLSFGLNTLATSIAADELLFKNATVFDGNRIIDTTDVRVVDGKISELGNQLTSSSDATIIQCDGHFLMPGMIDGHVHSYFPMHLQQALIFGVTTELDMMSAPRMAAMWRREQKDGGANARADIFSAGSAVTVAGGHGTQFGMPVPTLEDAEGAADFVNARVREGSDYIKIIYEDGKAFGMSMPTLTKKMLENSIAASKQADKLAVAHIGSQSLAKDAIQFGINGLVHLFADSEITAELLQDIKAKKVFITPTIAVISNTAGESSALKFSQDKSVGDYLTNVNLNNLSRTYPVRPGSTNSLETLNHNVKMLHDAGVAILCGTDAPNPGTVHGASMHHELELLVNAGLSPTAALTSATAGPARAYGFKDRGTIEVGKRADLILINGDPTKNILDSRKIVAVFKNGVKADRDTRKQQVANEMKKAESTSNASIKSKLVSDFEDGKVGAKFGAGWSISTDTIMGGKSKADMVIVKAGANSTSAMGVTGNIQVSQPAFGGVMFSPGPGPMQANDLSQFGKISFWTRCDNKEGRELQIMIFFQKRGFQPSMQSFKATTKWTKHSFDIESFDGCDGTDLTGIWFGTSTSGDFEFQIDTIRFDP